VTGYAPADGLSNPKIAARQFLCPRAARCHLGRPSAQARGSDARTDLAAVSLPAKIAGLAGQPRITTP
jgi:hypothetical protein